jgi:RNA polymerase sigma factor (sigma-70 family)
MSDDAALVRQTLTGNSSAFESLVEKYKVAALALALQYVHNFHDAQDITQEAFCSAYINLPNLTDPSRFRSWFFQIVINYARMWVRKQTRRTQREEAVAKAWTDIPVEQARFVESLAWRDIIEKAIESLSPSDQAIATFYFFDDRTCREVADALRLPVGTIKRRLHGIRKVLGKEVRTMLNEKGTLKHRVGIETLGGVLTHFFEKGTPLPARKTRIFTTGKDKQTEIDIHLVEGDAALVSDCRSLGRVTFKDISVYPKGVPQIIATFCIEKDGTLSIDAIEEFQAKPVSVEAKTGIETVSVQTL